MNEFLTKATFVAAIAFTYYLVAPAKSPTHLAPSRTDINAAILENLLAISTISADINCVSNFQHYSFTGGTLRAKGIDKFKIVGGASGRNGWYNGAGWNMNVPELPKITLMQPWTNDATNSSFRGWIEAWGICDMRGIYLLLFTSSSLRVSEETEVINGVHCYKMAGAGERVWVNKDDLRQIVRFELDDEHGNLNFRTDYSHWTAVGYTKTFPKQWHCEWIHPAKQTVYMTWDYSVSGITVGASIPDETFAVILL